MALLVRTALRPSLRLTQLSTPLRTTRTSMSNRAREEMKNYWKKNLSLNRPNSPWTVYHMHLPMVTSLTHRITGIVMGVALYGLSVGYAAGKYFGDLDFNSYVQFIKELNIPKPVLFVLKTIMAFPLCYHSVNGIRHLTWDYGRGFLLSTQYKSGSLIVTGSILAAMFLASYAYL